MQDAVNELHFHPKWFECDLLPVAFFKEQVDKYRQAEPDSGWTCSEHHRYFAFQAILSSRPELSDREIAQYLELCRLDEDQAMARAASLSLLSWRGLTPEQYDGLTKHPDFTHPIAQKIIWQKRMRGEVQSGAVSDAAFAEILEYQDSAFECYLVENANLSRHQLETLAEHGSNRAVRNIAKERLKCRK